MGLDTLDAVPAAQFGGHCDLHQRQQESYCGTQSLLRSALLETLVALLQAPLRMLAHSLFVVVELTGLKLELNSPPHEAAAVPWAHALRQLAPMSLVVVALAIGIAFIDASALAWPHARVRHTVWAQAN